MKFLGILISLAIIGYAITVYLDSSSLTNGSPEGIQSKPKDYIDQAKETTDAMSETLQAGKKRLDNSN